MSVYTMLSDSERTSGEYAIKTSEVVSGRPVECVARRGDWSVWIVESETEITLPDGARISEFRVSGTDLPESNHLIDYHGNWHSNQYGWTFRSDCALINLPYNRAGMIAYLSSGLFKGVGIKTAERIVERFGEKTYKVIAEHPEKLAKIRGLSKKAEAISATFNETSKLRSVIGNLVPYGVSPRLAVRVAAAFDNPQQVISENPYELTKARIGVGFTTADRIARANGISESDPKRIAAAINYHTRRSQEDGNCYVPERLLARAVAERLRSETYPDPYNNGIKQMLDLLIRRSYMLRLPPDRCYQRSMLRFELSLADVLIKLSVAEVESRPATKWRADFDAAASSLGVEPSEEQIFAAETLNKSPFLILTGGAGSGKTTALKLLIAALAPEQVLLCAPTGRAARRMADQTGYPAQTIHRALGILNLPDSPSELLYREEGEVTNLEVQRIQELPGLERIARAGKGRKLYEAVVADEEYRLGEYDLVIVDEVSMINTVLAALLLSEIRPGTRIVLVGDPRQLPAIGAGNVLTDILRAEVLPTVYLSRNFRQDEESLIPANAERISVGENIRFGADCEYHSAANNEEAADLIRKLYPLLVEKYGLDEVLVLVPIRGDKGRVETRPAAGVFALNHMLREMMNPPRKGAAEVTLGGQKWRPGDKVMQTRNRQMNNTRGETCDLNNGDIGYVGDCFADEDGSGMIVKFDGASFIYNSEDAADLQLAYASTVHKAQGSEYAAVIIVLLDSHYVLLKRDLLYTALTRAKREAHFVGQRSAISRAIRTPDAAERFTSLGEMLSDAEFRAEAESRFTEEEAEKQE